MLIGIDLLWLRPGIVGGTESFSRNLLDGFGLYDRDNEYVLFVAKDNADAFQSYKKYKNIRLYVCDTECAQRSKRVLWENMNLHRIARKENVDIMFIPVYSKPFSYGKKIPYVCVIHDVQALHHPQYFSEKKRLYLRYMWRSACKGAARIFTDSKFCENDLKKRYPFAADKIHAMYVPIITKDTVCDFEKLKKKYGIEKGEYYYCVSSLLPHKNLNTLLKVVAKRKKEGLRTPLVISGVGGHPQSFVRRIAQLDIADMVINTGFISDEERDCLYEHCKLFLFPSIFEGFGMPPIEAMRKGKNVVTTRKSCLEEVTEGKAIYVDDPFDVQEWMDKILLAEEKKGKKEAFAQYDLEKIVGQYMACWKSLKSMS